MPTTSPQTKASAPGKPANPQTLIDQVIGGFSETASEVVPWFVSQMPLMYFQDTDPATQVTHLRAIIAAKASGRPVKLTLRSEDGTQWTSMRPADRCGVLAELVSELPNDQPLRAAKIHTARDGNLVVDTFEFGEAPRFDPENPEQAEKLEQLLDYARQQSVECSISEMTDYIHRCPAEYVRTVSPLRMCRHMQLVQQVSGSDGATIALEDEDDPPLSRIVVAVSNATTRTMLERIAVRLSQFSINVHRAYLDQVEDNGGSISMLGFVVENPDGGRIDPKSELWKRVSVDLKRLKWIDPRTLDLVDRHPTTGLVEAEVITALSDLAYQALCKENPYAFTPDRIVRLIDRNLPHALRVARLFLERFDYRRPLQNDAFEQQCDQLREAIENEVDLTDAATLLLRMIDAVTSVFRTNVYLDNRYALSMRLSPVFLATEERSEMPHGVFFVHGRSFNGFHVRFRDIARGGIRAILPFGVDQHAREAERLYDEAYQLAHAQQLKNKDIPEGGAKAAILLEPDTRVDRSVKGFVDALLDLIVDTPETRERVVDLYGRPELLYLGPDENITPDLINWIVNRAAQRGYPIPTALMSSKPGAGINHKEYGVTSEGVNVFLDVALNAVGINPRKQPFTVKITGGPDGDVAGNEIRILHREYGDNARVIGIADGSGVGEDPDGLDHEELLRLVRASLPIAHFDHAKLGPRGRVVALGDPEGVHLRNTLHNRIVADAFVPCGGRPAAINESNWKNYLTSDGVPTSKVIVEGANLFLTPSARRALASEGVLILKDSSANKCGVICSSYEIISCMLLREAEFLAIKDTFVQQVLSKLRTFARREAELLMRVHGHMPDVPVPDLSIRLSAVTIRTADAIESAIGQHLKTNGSLLRQLVIDHLPPILVERAGDRIWTDLPEAYIRWIMAKSLATRIVYREGFEYLESMPMHSIADLALRYLHLEVEREGLIDAVEHSDLPSRLRIASLLRTSGILSTMEGTANGE